MKRLLLVLFFFVVPISLLAQDSALGGRCKARDRYRSAVDPQAAPSPKPAVPQRAHVLSQGLVLGLGAI